MVNQAKTEVPSQAALISEATCIQGSIRGATDLIVHGRIEGQIQIDRGLFVQPTGVVKADVVAESVVVQGVLVGNVVASQSVQITAEGRVVGNVSAPRFSMAEGALYRGHVETDEAAIQEITSQQTEVRQPATRPAAFQRSPPPQVAAPVRPALSLPNFARGAVPAPPPAPARLSFKPLDVRPRANLSQPPAPPPPPPPFQALLLREEEMAGGVPGDDDLTPQPALIGKRKTSLKRKK